MLGLGVFVMLSSARAAQDERGASLPPLAATAAPPAPQEAPVEARPIVAPVAAPASTFQLPINAPVTLMPSPVPRPVTASPFYPAPKAPGTPSVDTMRDRMRAPTLVIDMAQADVPRLPGSAETTMSDSGAVQTTISSDRAAGTTTVSTGPAAVGPAASSTVNRSLSDTEQFASRVGNEESQSATARRMTNLDRMIPQGAIIGAVMETALNSDQPGFARAITARDAYSFDGSTILIPAGSRVIGQYKSGVAQGGSRLFVLWTRLIRPDGVSIELASPAVDDLGRGGLGGKVNRHFIQRFGGAILTSVLTGGLSALAASRSNGSAGSTIIVNSAGQATTLAAQAGQSNDIPPTITTRQGATVRIFVARDLDFTRVGPAR
jgi:type IV secretory pathway VirB10-like protein